MKPDPEHSPERSGPADPSCPLSAGSCTPGMAQLPVQVLPALARSLTMGRDSVNELWALLLCAGSAGEAVPWGDANPSELPPGEFIYPARQQMIREDTYVSSKALGNCRWI